MSTASSIKGKQLPGQCYVSIKIYSGNSFPMTARFKNMSNEIC